MMNTGIAQAIGTGASAVPVFFLVFDHAIRLMQIGPVNESIAQRDYPVDSALTIGLLGLVCIAVVDVLSRRQRRNRLLAGLLPTQRRLPFGSTGN
jgi:hypothetical protein